MSFFGPGFDTTHDVLTKEKEKFLAGGLGAQEDVAVYTWGGSDYDGLGDALQEGGDELNDETFGGSGPVGKDFDFSNQGLLGSKQDEAKPEPRREYQDSLLHGKPRQAHHTSGNSVEAIWDDKSPSSVLLGARSAGRVQGAVRQSSSAAIDSSPPAHNSMRNSHANQASISSQHGIRTLQEIEAEMRAKQTQTNQNRTSSTSPAGQEHVSRTSVTTTHPSAILLHQISHISQSNSPIQPPAQPQLTPEEVEHQLRMMHLSQLQHHQAQRQEQQHPIYQSMPQPRQQYLRTPEHAFHQQLHVQRSYPGTPEPQYPIHAAQLQQGYMTQQQRQHHMQQQLLAQLSQAGVTPDQIHLLDTVQRDAIMKEALRKILAAEELDQKNRRRVLKMERMARYNDLMTQSDKDFITRIQVSQLVTADPYTEDFYAQVLGSLRRNGMGMRWFGNAGVGLGVSGHRLGGRREHAMNRMAEQVYRIVENAKAREKEKGQHGFNPLQGVLGKTSGRSYKAAPRQLLQVESSPLIAGSPTSSPQLREAHAMIAEDSLHNEGNSERPSEGQSQIDTKEPLSHRQALAIIEKLFDYALDWENNRRVIPDEGTEARQKWEEEQMSLEARMWEGSQVTAPLGARHPHPLVLLLRPLKGKKVMKRLTRVMDSRQLRITMTLITRLFRDFDVVQSHHISEALVDSPEKQEMEKHIHVFEEFVLEAVLPALAAAPLPVVSGQLQLLRDPVAVARTRPGIILLTHIFARAAIIKDRTLTLRSGTEMEGLTQDDVASLEDFQDWQTRFDDLFENLAPHFLSLFPSSRVTASLPYGIELPMQTSLALDVADHPVWSFFASMAVPASMEQQQILVTQLREKVLENVLSANKGWVADENERNIKLRNVNIFLHALGLDSSQINL